MFEKILIIDNDPEMAMLLRMLIGEMTSYKIEVTNNPPEAVELVKNGGFDLVIAEMRLPVMDGIELIGAIKRIDADIPVIILSDYGTVETALEAMRKGAFDYIAKPFRKEQMLYAIDNALKLRISQKENKILKERLNRGNDPIFDKRHLAHPA
ncbi:MAG: response regulator [Nitrospirae bacterium]|nr:response regulator [Nitrospirota bacterium]